MTPEGKVKRKVSALLKRLGAYYFMPVQSGFGKKTLDYLCCYRGEFFAIETKAPGKLPTQLQYVYMDEIARAGGVAFVVDCDDDIRALEEYLRRERVP